MPLYSYSVTNRLHWNKVVCANTFSLFVTNHFGDDGDGKVQNGAWESQQSPHQQDKDSIQEQKERARFSQIGIRHLVVPQAVVFENLVVCQHFALEFNDLGIVLVQIISNDETSVQVDDLCNV